MRNESAIHIDTAAGDQLLQLDNLSNLLKRENLVLLVAIYGNTGGVVTTVFESRKTCGGSLAHARSNCAQSMRGHQRLTIHQGIQDELAVLLDEVVDVTKDTTARSVLARGMSDFSIIDSGLDVPHGCGVCVFVRFE